MMKNKCWIVLLSMVLLLSSVTGTVSAEEPDAYPVAFAVTPEDASVTVSHGIGYTYTEETEEGTKIPGTEDAPAQWSYSLTPGDYTATITKDGCYASVFSFTVTETGKATAVNDKGNVTEYLSDGVFAINLGAFLPSDATEAWDGITLDVSWYDEDAQTMTIYTPAQLSGMAAIVNGIFNAEITAILDDADGDGLAETYTPSEYARLKNRKIRPACSTAGTGGNNLVTTDSYWYGVKSDDSTPSDFNGQTVLLACDLDMGGWQKDGVWTGARYMTIGGQNLMHYIDYPAWRSDGFSHLGSSFNGTLDGQGHYVRNIYCDRYGAGTNYGDSSSIGLVGRLGCHDNDPLTLMAVDPTVKDLAVTGYIYGRRSVGGIVGKIGQTTASRLADGSTGGIIESCMNFAEVCNTDAKGCGGIAGAGWNKGVIRYCANFGYIHSSYTCPTGGISGSNEVPLESCYSVGTISAAADSYAMGIGTNNGGATTVDRCFWLTGTASGGGYYNGKGAVEITNDHDGSGLSAEDYMKSDAFLAALNGSGRAWTFAQADSYPVPRVFTEDTATVTGLEKTSDPVTTEYVAGQRFDPTGLAIYALYSDGTRALVEDYHITPDRPLQAEDTQVVISGTFANHPYRYEYPVTVVEAALTGLVISKAPDNLLYASDEVFSPAGMVVQAFYSNAPDAGVTLSAQDYSWTLEGTVLTVSYTYVGKTLQATCEVIWLDTPKPLKNNGGCYQLYTENDLRWFANQVNALGLCSIKAAVMADITVTSTDFSGIGASGKAYCGSFDGGGHTVTLQMHTDGAAGLFAQVGAAKVSDLTVAGEVSTSSPTAGAAGLAAYVAAEAGQAFSAENCVNRAAVSAPAYAGGLVGKSMTSAVCLTNCRNEGAVSASGGYVGGMAGYTAGGSRMEGCVNAGTITGGGNCGGIVGYLRVSSDQRAAYITDCSNTGTLNASSDNVGGIVGYLAGSGAETNITVSRCENGGAVTGANAVGGIAGYAFYREDRIMQCLNTGAVTCTGTAASRGAGGIVGCSRATVSDVYNLGTVSAFNDAAGSAVGVGGILGTAAQTGTAVENAYHAGTLHTAGAASAGSIVGYAAADVTLTNCHCLAGACWGSTADGKTVTGTVTEQTSETLAALADVLGGAFHASDICALPYPILTWQQGAPHQWNEGEITLAPTCTKPGQRTVTCLVCGQTQLTELPAIDCPTAAFTDIGKTAWYHDAVDFMAERQYMNGVGGGRFDPDGTLSRAQLVTIVYRIAGSPAVSQSQNPFTDVPAGTWYTDAVIWAAENSVVNGTGSGQFSPDGQVTREQIAAILYRYVHASPEADDCLSAFPDQGKIASYAREAMNWAVSSGLLRGAPGTDGRLCLFPQDSATRAEISQIFLRWLDP